MQSPPSLVGVRTGWLHRAGQEARGCSQRCLVLLIIVFLKVQIKGWWLGLEKQEAAGEFRPASLCLHGDGSMEELPVSYLGSLDGGASSWPFLSGLVFFLF